MGRPPPSLEGRPIVEILPRKKGVTQHISSMQTTSAPGDTTGSDNYPQMQWPVIPHLLSAFETVFAYAITIAFECFALTFDPLLTCRRYYTSMYMEVAPTKGNDFFLGTLLQHSHTMSVHRRVHMSISPSNALDGSGTLQRDGNMCQRRAQDPVVQLQRHEGRQRWTLPLSKSVNRQ